MSCPQFRQQRLYSQAGIGGDSHCGGDVAAEFLGIGVYLDNLLVGLDSPGHVGREHHPAADSQDDVGLREGDMTGPMGVVETAQGQRTVFRDRPLTLRSGYYRGVQGLGQVQKLGGHGSVPCAAASPDQGAAGPCEQLGCLPDQGGIGLLPAWTFGFREVGIISHWENVPGDLYLHRPGPARGHLAESALDHSRDFIHRV